MKGGWGRGECVECFSFFLSLALAFFLCSIFFLKKTKNEIQGFSAAPKLSGRVRNPGADGSILAYFVIEEGIYHSKIEGQC